LSPSQDDYHQKPRTKYGYHQQPLSPPRLRPPSAEKLTLAEAPPRHVPLEWQQQAPSWGDLSGSSKDKRTIRNDDDLLIGNAVSSWGLFKAGDLKSTEGTRGREAHADPILPAVPPKRAPFAAPNLANSKRFAKQTMSMSASLSAGAQNVNSDTLYLSHPHFLSHLLCDLGGLGTRLRAPPRARPRAHGRSSARTPRCLPRYLPLRGPRGASRRRGQ